MSLNLYLQARIINITRVDVQILNKRSIKYEVCTKEDVLVMMPEKKYRRKRRRPHNVCSRSSRYVYLLNKAKLEIEIGHVCAPVWRDNPRALTRRLSTVSAHKQCPISLVP